MPTFNVLSAALIVTLLLIVTTALINDSDSVMNKSCISKYAKLDLSIIGQYSHRSTIAVQNMVYNALATAYQLNRDLAPKVYAIAREWVLQTVDPYGYFALGVENARFEFSKKITEAEAEERPVEFKVHLGAYKTPAKSLLYNDRLDVHDFINSVNLLLEVSS